MHLLFFFQYAGLPNERAWAKVADLTVGLLDFTVLFAGVTAECFDE